MSSHIWGNAFDPTCYALGTINEVDRIPIKHLLTLQEGVSEGQFREMQEAGVQLVAPMGLHVSYPDTVRPYLVSFESFIGDVRLLNLPR